MAKQSMTTILQARDCLPTRMNNGIELTIEALNHVLDYCYDNPNIIKYTVQVIRYHLLTVAQPIWHLVEQKARSRTSWRILLFS